MQILDKQTHIDFLGRRRVALIVSGLLMLVSLGSLLARGLNFGIEFTGGIVIEAGFSEAANLGRIRGDLGTAGYGEAVVQNFGSSRDVTIQPPRHRTAIR